MFGKEAVTLKGEETATQHWQTLHSSFFSLLSCWSNQQSKLLIALACVCCICILQWVVVRNWTSHPDSTGCPGRIQCNSRSTWASSSEGCRGHHWHHCGRSFGTHCSSCPDEVITCATELDLSSFHLKSNYLLWFLSWLSDLWSGHIGMAAASSHLQAHGRQP